MDKAELAGYLASLTFLMDYHQRLGTTQNTLVVAEYLAREAEFHNILKQEQENETGNGK